MSNLQLSLKTKWFEMTKAGIKTEDYREITPYWANRLVENTELSFWNDRLAKDGRECIAGFFLESLPEIIKFQGGFKKFTQNTMTLGYPKSGYTERILKLEHKGIEIRKGNPDWGAEPDKLYFVILHGSVVE